MPKQGSLRVWHVPQVLCEPFLVGVETATEAQKLCRVLADYDAFQFEHKIKPDYCNTNGVQRLGEGGGWVDLDGDELEAVIELEAFERQAMGRMVRTTTYKVEET